MTFVFDASDVHYGSDIRWLYRSSHQPYSSLNSWGSCISNFKIRCNFFKYLSLFCRFVSLCRDIYNTWYIVCMYINFKLQQCNTNFRQSPGISRQLFVVRSRPVSQSLDVTTCTKNILYYSYRQSCRLRQGLHTFHMIV